MSLCPEQEGRFAVLVVGKSCMSGYCAFRYRSICRFKFCFRCRNITPHCDLLCTETFRSSGGRGGGGGYDEFDDDDDNLRRQMWLKKEAEKILKYKDLTTEIQRMWNVKTKVIPVKIGATGTISKSFRKYVSNITGKHEVKELQKTAILGTAHILRKVLM